MTKDYDKALRLLRIAAVKVDEKFEAHRRMLKGEPALKTKNIIGDTTVAKPETRSPLLSKVRDEWFKMKAIEGGWTKRTTDQNQAWTDRFITIVGDRPIDQYTKADGRKFRDVMSKFPKNVDKFKELKGFSVQNIPQAAESMGLELMSRANVNKYIIGASALWKWISRNYDEEPSNPLDGMAYKIKVNPKKDRDPFTTEELNIIFKAPTFTGCRSYKGWRNPGTYSLRDSYRYWIPLIGLFTGMRLGEMCQLYTEDVREKQGITFFDIHANREDMSLKTAHSERQIPVHAELFRLGFKMYVKRLRAEGQERFFPDLKMSSEGYWSKNASAHFQRFFKVVGVKHGKNCFHSFRHCFEDACRASGVPKEVMDAIQGHRERGMAARYGSGYELGVLNEAMKRIQYGALNLKHLY
nr:site-specific integrase [Pseudodesulfovibrio sediminis]